MSQNCKAVFVILPVGCEENTLSESKKEGFESANNKAGMCCMRQTSRSLTGLDIPLPDATTVKTPKLP